MQREGILKLDAFLRSSSHMVVMHIDIFLTMLWAVYDVVCFLSLEHFGPADTTKGMHKFGVEMACLWF